MKRYEMTPALRTGNEMIDMEHERIFEEVNALLEACQTGHARGHLGEMADFLADYVAVHFADEENLQTEFQYPDYSSHKKFHEWYKRELKKNLNEVKAVTNSFEALGKINHVIDILLKHIENEDSRLAKWVQERSRKAEAPARETSTPRKSQFVSGFQPSGGKKEIDLRGLLDVSQLQKRQELFAEATGLACVITDLSGRYLTKGSGSRTFFSHHASGRHEGLLEFTEALVLDGFQIGMIIGGAEPGAWDGNGQITQASVSAAGQLFAETINSWVHEVAADKKDTGSRSVFHKEAGQVQEAIRQIKSRAKGLEQTATMEKMLSLNAAIEAGRAGKAGVGFAVVAEEIGRMANESAAVYREIQELVRQVETSMARMEQSDF